MLVLTKEERKDWIKRLAGCDDEALRFWWDQALGFAEEAAKEQADDYEIWREVSLLVAKEMKRRELVASLKRLKDAFQNAARVVEDLRLLGEEAHELFAERYPFAMSFDEQAAELTAWVEKLEGRSTTVKGVS